MKIRNREISMHREARPSEFGLSRLIYFLARRDVCVMIAQVYGKRTMQRPLEAGLTHNLLDRWTKERPFIPTNMVTGRSPKSEYRLRTTAARDEGRLILRWIENAVLSAVRFIADAVRQSRIGLRLK